MVIKFFNNNSLFESIEFPNSKSTYIIGNGRGDPVDITIDHPAISRKHAELLYTDHTLYIKDLNSTNGTFINNARIPKNNPIAIKAGDVIRFAADTPAQALVFDTSQANGSSANLLQDLLQNKEELLIGRSPECDVVLDGIRVSRKHCSIRRTGNGYRVKDLESRNGTFVNGKRITTEVAFTESDTLLVGNYKLVLAGPIKNLTEEVAIRLVNLYKKFPKNKVGFDAVSIDVPNQGVVGIMGPSGCGKSTLLKTLTGVHAASGGQVFIHGLEFTAHYEYIKTHIGYVPQDDIVHSELTVTESLYFTCKLRQSNWDDEKINQKINQVLEQLNIRDTKDQLIHSLSGGQRKRVSIAAELMSDPLILFLDEPTSPLDPQNVEDLLKILKGLANQGTTIVMVTHKPEDLAHIDKVLFLAKGGKPVFYGAVDEHLAYFTVKRTVEIYALLSGEPEQVAVFNKRFNQNNQPLAPASFKPRLTAKAAVDLASQTYWLTRRTLRIKVNDKTNTGILLLQAPIIALLINLIFKELRLQVLFLLCITAIWLGTNNASKEIANEKHVYERERLYNLHLFPYITSKLLVFLLLGILQSLAITVILSMRFPLTDFSDMFLWFIVLTFCSSLLGLCISAKAKNIEQVISSVPLALIPQLMLAGVLAPVNNLFVEGISYFSFARWGTEGFTIIHNSSSPDVTPPSPDLTTQLACVLTKPRYHQKYSDMEIFGGWTETLQLDTLMLSLLSLLLLLLLIRFLKQKDIM